MIKQYRDPSSTHFCIYPFKLSHQFYGFRRELVNKFPIINWFPCIFCLILDYHQGCVYCKSDMTSCLIDQVGRVFANDPGDLGSIPGHVIPKTLKMVLDTSLLNTQ